MWAAIRYRRAQALVLVLLSALIAACAALAPLYSRALEQGLLRQQVFRAEPADTALSVKASRTPTAPDLGLDRLDEVVPQSVKALHHHGIGTLTGQVLYAPFPGRPPAHLSLVYRDGMCEHVRLTTGRCPQAAGEVAVTQADLALWKWKLGTTLHADEKDAPSDDPGHDLTVVGAYEQQPDDAYWMRLQLGGRSGGSEDGGNVPTFDDWLTAEASFDDAWGHARLTMQYPLNRDLVTLDDIPATAAALATASRSSNEVTLDSPMPSLLTQIRAGQGQVRLVVPLLMAQLALLGAVVLLSVAAAAVEQRRPEVALARLRGRSRDGARWLVMGELGLTVLLGLPVGLVLALAVNEAARRFVLPPGVPFEFPLGVLLALLAAAAVSVFSVWVAAQPVLREPISSLLRRVASARSSRRWPVVDVVIVALALAGIAGLATSSGGGPLALMTPTLLSLAVGLVLANAVLHAAASAGGASVRRGRLASALAAYQLARRPAVRKVLTIITVATALAVFAAGALVIGDRNRENRAQLEAGAPVALVTDAVEPARLERALDAIDPSGTTATPVAVIRPRDPGSTPTIALVPKGFRAVGFAPPQQEPLRLDRLEPPTVRSVRLADGVLTATVSSTVRLPADDRGSSGAATLRLGVVVTTPDGQRLTRDLAVLQVPTAKPVRLRAPVLCPRGCRLDSLTAKVEAPASGGRRNPWEASGTAASPQATGQVSLSGLALDGTALDLGDADRWQQSTKVDAAPDDVMRPAQGSSGDHLVVDVANSGVVLAMPYADVPARVPAVLAGPVPPGGTAATFTAYGLSRLPTTMAAVQQVPALPLVGARGALVNFETMSRLGGQVPDTGSLEVWVASPSAAERVRQGLRDDGINVLTTRSYAETKSGYDQSASGWGLQLALVTGLVALLLAALVMVVVAATGWRSTVHDYAALRMAGVSTAALRAAARREQLVVVGVGVLAGTVCGLLGAHLAMPLVPLFSTPAAVPALDLSPAWGASLVTAAMALLLLGLVGLAVGWAVVGRVTLSRVREHL